ncbi:MULTISPECIES: PQQ-binding-like beta-propeller repeat protein [Streptomyces]
MSPPPAPGGRRKALLITLALTLLLTGLGGGGWWLWGRGDDGGGGGKPQAKPPATGRLDSQLDWLVTNPDKDDQNVSKGKGWTTWFANGNIIRTRTGNITAYDTAHGKQQWNVRIPGPLCATSRRAEKGVGVVAYAKDGYSCSDLMAVDLRSGRAKWDKKMPTRYSSGYTDMQIVLLNDTVKILSADESATFAVDDGRVLAQPDKNMLLNCVEYRNSTDGTTLLAVIKCPHDRMFVQRIDPSTGKDMWTWKVPDGLKMMGIPSVDPVVVAVAKVDERDNSTDLITITPEGRTRNRISLTGNGNAANAVFSKDTVYLSTEGTGSGSAGESTNKIIAIDLATGQKRWASDAGGKRVGVPLKFLGDKPLIYQYAQGDEGGRLVTLEPRDGTPTVVKRLPAESAREEREAALFGEVYFEDGRVFMASGFVGSPSHLLLSFN